MASFAIAAILILLLLGLAFNLARPATLFFIAAISAYLLNLTSFADTFSHFTNSSLLLLVLILMATTALEKTPLLSSIGKLIGNGKTSSLFRLGLTTAALSSITNNTAVVATLIRVIKRHPHLPAGKFLLPLSYAAILGGTLTLIGTSTHLIVNSFVVEAGLQPIGFFEFSYIGLIIVSVCLPLLVLLALGLKDRTYHDDASLPYFLEATVNETSKLIGNSVLDNQLRALKQLYLAELERNGVKIAPVPPGLTLKAGDKLRFSGALDSVELLHQFDGLEWFAKSQADGQNLVEAVIAPGASLVGRSLKSVLFRENFDGAVMAIRRGQQRLSGGLGDTKLAAGDALLICPGSDFSRRARRSGDFTLVSGVDLATRLEPKKAVMAILGFAGVLVLNLLQLVDLTKGFIVLMLAYVALGILNLRELKRRFPVELVVIVGSALSLASIMYDTGLANQIAQGILTIFNPYGVMGAFIGVYLMTLLLTEMVTNNAAAALAFPIAYSLALHYGVEPRSFIMAVVFGASASLISPFSYQTHLMVLPIGNYKFRDYLRLGLPISIVYSALIIWLVPKVFPF